MYFSFVVEVNVEREQGKFVSRDDIYEILVEAIDQGANDADLSGIGPDSTSDYTITDVSISTNDK